MSYLLNFLPFHFPLVISSGVSTSINSSFFELLASFIMFLFIISISIEFLFEISIISFLSFNLSRAYFSSGSNFSSGFGSSLMNFSSMLSLEISSLVPLKINSPLIKFRRAFFFNAPIAA